MIWNKLILNLIGTMIVDEEITNTEQIGSGFMTTKICFQHIQWCNGSVSGLQATFIQWFRDPLLFLSCGSTFLPCHLLHLARRRKERIRRKCNNFWKSGPTNAIFTFPQRKLTSIAYLDTGWPENLVLNLGNASQWWCYIIEYLSQGSHRNFHCFPSPPS